MSAKKDGGHAFPTFYADPNVGSGYPGMTLRDYFAAAAMTGLLSYWQQTQQTERDFAKDAYLISDAMLAERSRKEAQP